MDHGSWLVLSAPDRGGFLRLSPSEAAWLRSGPSGEVAAPPDARDLLDDLADGGFLEGTQPDARAVRVMPHGLEFQGAQRPLATLYQLGLRHLLRPSAVAACALVALAGAVALVIQLAWGRPLATEVLSPVIAGLVLLALDLLATLLHEMAHALYLTHCGRTVRGVGFGFYWGSLSFFVDAGEALLLPRRQRMAQAAAGPFADAVLAGAASLLALLAEGPAQSLLLTFAVFGWLSVAGNLVPFLELDGYWILADLLDRPQLRREAWQAAHQTLRGRRQGLTGLALYGITSIAFGVILVGAALWVWWWVVGDLLFALAHEGPLGWFVAAALALPVLASWATLLLQLVIRAALRRGDRANP
jgi:putative peptide zinc metalloprotease protein